jgi:hypothetical protein
MTARKHDTDRIGEQDTRVIDHGRGHALEIEADDIVGDDLRQLPAIRFSRGFSFRLLRQCSRRAEQSRRAGL